MFQDAVTLFLTCFRTLSVFVKVVRVAAQIEYLTGESWNFDYGHCWPDDDIEGFRTDATFVERVHRYAFTVLMKGHTTLWDAIEELRRSVREKYGVEHVHLQFGSDPRTITQILRQ